MGKFLRRNLHNRGQHNRGPGVVKIPLIGKLEISAAHCTWGRHPTNVFLVAGSINRFQGGVSFPLSNIHYINYNPATRENE
jgi:hypothetical protein